MLAVGQLENCRLGLARRARLKPLKQLYNCTKASPISESRRRLVTRFATWREGLDEIVLSEK